MTIENLKPWLLSTVLAAISLILLLWIPEVKPFSRFSWILLGAFALFSLILHFLFAKAAQSRNKNLFTQLTLLTSMGKLMLAIVALLVYTKLVQPPTRFYVFPFMVIYIIYTIFETKILMKLAYLQAKNLSKNE